MEYTYTEMADRYERQYRRGIIAAGEFGWCAVITWCWCTLVH